MENVTKGHTIHSDQINIFNENSKYHTTTDHMKIYAMENPYHRSLCAKKFISRSHMKRNARENLNPYELCVREKSYQGRDAVQGLLNRIYITVLCVAKDLYPGTSQRDM